MNMLFPKATIFLKMEFKTDLFNKGLLCYFNDLLDKITIETQTL